MTKYDETWLLQQVRQGSDHAQRLLRPFLPNPDWKSASVIIVGKNPARPLPISAFGDIFGYWRSLTVTPATFWRVYCTKEPSITSIRENNLKENLAPMNVLITNVWPYPVPSGGRVPEVFRRLGEEMLGGLIHVCRPKAIFFHSKPAVEFANRHLHPERKLDLANVNADFTHGRLDDGTATLLFPYAHLSGLGAPAGFPVRDMDEHLVRFAHRIHEALGVSAARQYQLSHIHPCQSI